MQVQRRRDTQPELALRRELRLRGLGYRVHRKPESGVRREADVLFVGRRVVVFVDGCYWHGCPEHATWPTSNSQFWREKIEGNRSRDTETDLILTSLGWVVVRVWEHEDPSSAADRIASILPDRRRRRT